MHTFKKHSEQNWYCSIEFYILLFSIYKASSQIIKFYQIVYVIFYYSGRIFYHSPIIVYLSNFQYFYTINSTGTTILIHRPLASSLIVSRKQP